MQARLIQQACRLQPAAVSRAACLPRYHSCSSASGHFGRMHDAARLSSLTRSASSEKLHALANGSTAWRRSPPPAPQHSEVHVPGPAATPFSGAIGVVARCGNISGAGADTSRLGVSVTRTLSRRLSLGDWGRPLPWLRLPDELWGAVNVLTAAASPATEKPPRGAGISKARSCESDSAVQ